MSGLSCSVLVVGAGLAGWSAALRAVEYQADVLLIDKSPGEVGGGNTLMTSGSLRAAGRSLQSESQELYREVMKEGVAYPELARAWADHCPASVDRLRGWGVELVDGPAGGLLLEPRTSISLSPVYKRDVGTNVLRKLRASFIQRGGRYAGNTQALRLLIRSGGVNGVVAQSNGRSLEIQSKAVILTTGGFSANKEMVAKYIGRHAHECKLRGSPNDTGDGLRMATEIGAKAVNLSYFYGHLLSLKALSDDRFWPYPRLDSLVNEGILVDRLGNRFADEGRGDMAVTNELARSDDVKGACLIFDEEAWQDARSDGAFPYPRTPSANPWLMENDGFLYKRETPEELARAIDVGGGNLARTLDSFNKASERGSFEGIPIPRSGKTRPFRSPLYGLRVVPGITFTMGGILINGHAQVLNLDERPIRGLYAAGDATGGLMGGYHGGYQGGLCQAIVTGILAGEDAAGFAKGSSALVSRGQKGKGKQE